MVALVLIAAGAAVWFFFLPKPKESPAPEGKNNWSTMDQGPYRDQISYATSSDLLNWTDSDVILAEHASVPDAVYRRQDGTIYVYFVDVSQDGRPEQIGLIRSADGGKTWLDKIIANIQGLGDKVTVDPDPFVLADGRVRLYFFDIADTHTPGNSGKIYSALSDDGINFVLEQGVRWERKAGLFDPDVVWVDGIWYMYVGDGAGQKTVLATSTDGLNFTEFGVVYNEGAIPNVYFDGTKFILYTGGINIAFSNDGKTFTKTPYRFESSSGLTADPGVFRLLKNEYLMVFKTKIPE